MEAVLEKDVEVVVDSISEVIATGAVEVDVVDNTDLAVSVNRKEFNIVGDELYIPKRYEDAPQWLRDLIVTVTEQSYTQKITELNNLSTSLQQLIIELEVAKNTYTQSIISSNDIDERINTAITTLNSSLSGSDATIVDLVSTKATPEEASAIALNTISSSINDGEIGALVGAVSNTLATETGALASNIDLVHAEMLGGFESTADVIQTTQAYVGIDEAGASTGTGLSAYLEDSLGNIGGADSQVVNAVYINNGVPTSKFEYTSDLSKNGVHYKSGFGLKTLATGGDGSAANPYDSEFWINAAKFKFTNDNVTGQVAPFTIDATGLTPNVTFNGKVSFTNVTGYTPPDVSGSISTNNDVFAQKLGYANYAAMVAAAASGQTVINGGYINTGLINTGAINANMVNTAGLIAEDISSSIISGKTINGGVINGARINGAVIKASYLDLNGELEVLTNFIISTAMYNANPSLYSDSVFISSDNTYRIPTSSVIYEQAIPSSMPNNGDVLYGSIRSYNCANAGHNNKAIKIRPTISVSSPVTIMDMRQSASYNCNGSFYLGDILLINLAIVSLNSNTLVYSVTTADSGTSNYTIYDSNANASTFVFSDVRTIVSSGISFTISVGAANSQYGYSASAIIKLDQGNHTLTRDFNYTNNGFKLMRLYNNNGGADSCTTALGTNIYINNLL